VFRYPPDEVDLIYKAISRAGTSALGKQGDHKGIIPSRADQVAAEKQLVGNRGKTDALEGGHKPNHRKWRGRVEDLALE